MRKGPIFSGVLLIFLLVQLAFAEEKLPKVFICQSYGPGEGCGAEIEIGLNRMLKSLGWEDSKTMRVFRFYMDTQTRYKEPADIKARGKLALEKIRQVDPDLLIVMDDNAFEYVGLPLAKSKYPIVFGGVNLDPEYYDEKVDFMISRQHPGYNITGVKEMHVSASSCRLFKQILPQTKKMVILAPSTYSFVRRQVEELKEDINTHPERYPIEIENIYQTPSWEEYQRIILELNRNPDIDAIYHFSIVGLYNKEGRGISVPEAIGWVVRNQTKPGFSQWADWVRMGFLAGCGNDLQGAGAKQAVQVHRVLKGESPADIPMEAPEDSSIALNLARAQQLGIEIPFSVLGAARVIFTQMESFPEFKYKVK